MDQGNAGYWYQDGADGGHANANYAYGEYNTMLENQVTGMQYDTAADAYGGHPPPSHQMNGGHYDPNRFSVNNDPASSTQHLYHDAASQSPSHAYIQPTSRSSQPPRGHPQAATQHSQFNPTYQHQYDEAGQGQPQQQQQAMYDGQRHSSTGQFQGHAQNSYAQGQYHQQPPQNGVHSQFQQDVSSNMQRNTASPVPQSNRQPPAQYQDMKSKPQNIQHQQSPQTTQATQFIAPYSGQNQAQHSQSQPIHGYQGQPVTGSQQAAYQGPAHAPPTGAYAYTVDSKTQQQTGQAISRSQGHTPVQLNGPYQAGPGAAHATNSQGPYFQPYIPHQQQQQQQQQQQAAPVFAQDRPIVSKPLGAMNGTQSYNEFQAHGQMMQQPQPSAPIVFRPVENHPYLSVSSGPVRYRARATRSQTPFTVLEHTFPEPPPKAKTGTKRKASATSTGEASSETESEEEDEESEVDRQACEILRKMGVPKNTTQAVEQEVVQRVWHDRNLVYDKEKTSKAIQWFGTYVDSLWVEVKKLKDNLKAAEDKGDKDKITSLQAATRHQNDLMHTAIQSADKFGEDYLVSNMGGNRKLCTIMRNALANCFTSKDFTGPYPHVLLRLMSRFTTIDTEFLAKLKLDTLRTKYGEQIDAEMHGCIDQILKNAKLRDEKTKTSVETSKDVKKAVAATKPASTDAIKKTPVLNSREAPTTAKGSPIKKEVDVKKPVPEIKKIDYSGLGSARKVSGGTTKPGLNGAPIKRQRDDDADARTAKKVAVEGSAGAPTTKAASGGQSIAPAATSAKPKISSSILAGKARSTVKPAVKRPEPAAPSAFSSISGLLAEIAKPKEAPKAREEPERAPETPEEMARRLRKEKRRKLRVVWKPDDQLEEVRIFQHDAAEDEGRASNNLRDARDNKSEGQMLKLGIQTDDEDDAEDDGKPKETSLRKWIVPNSVDFKSIDSAQRDKNVVSRGGIKDIISEQRKVMEEYESRELMAVYTTSAEIPETPRSPPAKAMSELSSQPRVGILPQDNAKMQEIHRRWQEFGQYGPAASQQMALSRLGINQSGHGQHPAPLSKPAATATPRYMTQEERNEAVLALLRSEAIKKWSDPEPFNLDHPRSQRRSDYPDPKVQEAADAIETICEKFRGKPFPPTEPPEHITSPDRAREWWAGHEKDMAAKAIKDAKERAKTLAEEQAKKAAEQKAAHQAQAAVQAQTQAAALANGNDMSAWAAYLAQAQGQDPAYAAILHQVQALQSAQQPAVQAQPSTNDINSLLATLGGGLASSASQAQVTDPAAAAWVAYYAQNQAQAQGQAQNQAQPDQQAAWAAYYAQYGTEQAQQNGNEQNNNDLPGIHPSRQQHNQHDDDHNARQDHHRGDREMRDRDWDRERDRGGRQHGNRGGAGREGRGGNNHGINRSLIGTKPCSFWAKGQCAKGDQCTFRHDPNDLK